MNLSVSRSIVGICQRFRTTFGQNWSCKVVLDILGFFIFRPATLPFPSPFLSPPWMSMFVSLPYRSTQLVSTGSVPLAVEGGPEIRGLSATDKSLSAIRQTECYLGNFLDAALTRLHLPILSRPGLGQFCAIGAASTIGYNSPQN